jgi:hypothetical protein
MVIMFRHSPRLQSKKERPRPATYSKDHNR